MFQKLVFIFAGILEFKSAAAKQRLPKGMCDAAGFNLDSAVRVEQKAQDFESESFAMGKPLFCSGLTLLNCHSKDPVEKSPMEERLCHCLTAVALDQARQ